MGGWGGGEDLTGSGCHLETGRSGHVPGAGGPGGDC